MMCKVKVAHKIAVKVMLAVKIIVYTQVSVQAMEETN